MAEGDTVVYNGIPNRRYDIERTLELQKLILDPDYRPYRKNKGREQDTTIVSHSASKETGLTVEKQLELQRKILDG